MGGVALWNKHRSNALPPPPPEVAVTAQPVSPAPGLRRSSRLLPMPERSAAPVASRRRHPDERPDRRHGYGQGAAKPDHRPDPHLQNQLHINARRIDPAHQGRSSGEVIEQMRNPKRAIWPRADPPARRLLLASRPVSRNRPAQAPPQQPQPRAQQPATDSATGAAATDASGQSAVRRRRSRRRHRPSRRLLSSSSP